MLLFLSEVEGPIELVNDVVPLSSGATDLPNELFVPLLPSCDGSNDFLSLRPGSARATVAVKDKRCTFMLW